MMPIRSMDSYPYQRNQMPLPQYYHPGIEALPPQMKVDPSKPHLSYDPRWPYAANYGHLIPPHFCCGHNNFPCHYGYMPSYPHAPSPMYYSGGCPAYTDPYFLPYSPQPHQTMELPRYEYDKHMPRDHHCCGCPNHSCNQKEGTSVKIEEHEPDVGRKVNGSLVPIQLKNYPYPVVWIPQEHTSNKQLNNPNTMEVGEQNKPPSIENANAVAQPAQGPRVWNGWLPFDVKGTPSMIHDGFGIRNQKQDSGNNRGESENGETDQKRQSELKRSEFPFPIFWLPYYNKQEESGETNNQDKNNSSPKIVEEVPHAVKSVPVKSHVDEGGMNRTRSDQAARPDTKASDVAEKVTNARSIPVKHIGKEVSLDQMEENVAKKGPSTDDKRGQSASLSKASKLPPVCLRVDPLPRNKNGNGSSRSRSLSPPSSKGQAQVTSGETTPVSGTNDKTQRNLNNQNAPKTTEKVEPKEKTIQEYECKTNEIKGVDKTDECESQINVNIPSEGSKRTKDTCTDGDECKIEDKEAGKGAENVEETTQLGEVKDSSTLTDVGSKEGRILSDADAAILIQAAYRGYQVRKWEPLKKLKQIDEVRKEMTNVQDRVQAFERSSDLQNDEKQKIAIGETIMRLLLKLDTIQGLHPSFREIRKSLARELTMLQERLDSLMANKTQQQMQAIQKDVEVTPTNMQTEEKLSMPGDSSEGYSDDGNVSQPPVDPVPNEGGESVILPNGSCSEDTIQIIAADTLNSTSDLSETDKMAVESEDKSEPKDIPIEVDELDMTVVKELPVGVLDEDSNDASIEKEEEHDNTGSGSVSVMENDSARDGLGSENHAMMELPVGLLDEDERDNEMNISKNGEFIEELPVGLLDEKAEEPKEEKDDEAKPKEVLMAQERECNADEETSSSTDDTSKETQSEQQQQPLEAQKEDIELPPLTTNANDHEAGNEDVSLEANDANNISAEPMESVTIDETQKEEEPEGKIALKETQKDGEEKVAETLAEEKAVSAALQADHDGGLNGESKLVEENEKLREMMKKLLEAGNEQLSVISDLTGRVKELEKRLARRSRNKRMKTKRYRSAASKISGMSP